MTTSGSTSPSYPGIIRAPFRHCCVASPEQICGQVLVTFDLTGCTGNPRIALMSATQIERGELWNVLNCR